MVNKDSFLTLVKRSQTSASGDTLLTWALEKPQYGKKIVKNYDPPLVLL